MSIIKGKQIEDNSIILSGTNGLDDNKIYIADDWTVGTNSLLTQKDVSQLIHDNEFITKKYADNIDQKFTEFTSGYYGGYTDIIYSEEIASSSGELAFVVPANYKITGITIEEISGDSGGLIHLGTDQDDYNILTSVIINASDLIDCNVTTFNINDRFFSFTQDTPVYATFLGWTTGVVKFYFTIQKVSGDSDTEPLTFNQQENITSTSILSFPVPLRNKINGIIIEETSGTGGGTLSLGSTSGGNDILMNIPINPNDVFDCNITTYNIDKTLFSLTIDTPLYLTLQNWDGAVSLYFTFQQI